MDLSGGPNCGVMSKPTIKDTSELLKVCKKLSASDLKKLMGVSDAIAKLDHERYQSWEKTQSKAACLAMDGPAYRGFEGSSLSAEERKIAQGKVRILSGLYGVLKPFDAIKPYRLEMGSKLKTNRGSSLYEFWADTLAKELCKGAKVIINAASQEYWKAVNVKALGGVPVVTVDFPGPAVYAKKARGLICRFAVQQKCQKAEDLKNFKGAPGDVYTFDASKSTKDKYVFRRVSGAAATKTSSDSKKRTASAQNRAAHMKRAKKA
eukprot:TRINITY_DN26568_c0_g2_i1.p1 TRINITY_DN26568_c0_g2~~TRINITY_DN26568_c0_g2_i1.p1  ORF type:complete len:293 (+),score=60.38 TRINITY_DN26568_c0_g2_i1:89-880(+)